MEADGIPETPIPDKDKTREVGQKPDSLSQTPDAHLPQRQVFQIWCKWAGNDFFMADTIKTSRLGPNVSTNTIISLDPI